MGSITSVYSQKSTEQVEPMKVIMTGLDGVGKSTILNQLTHRKLVTQYRSNIMPSAYCPINDYNANLDIKITTPMSGFQVETLTIPWKQIEITCWDVGGLDKILSQWSHFHKKVKAVVFVVDSNDWDRIDDARKEIHKIMSEALMEVPLLVLANKRDLPGIMNLSGMKECLAMYPFKGRRRRWRVHGICASQGLGVHEGFNWITSGCPDLLKTKYDLQLLRSLHQKGRASITNFDDENIKNLLMFICDQPSEICEMIEKYLGVIDCRVTGIEYAF